MNARRRLGGATTARRPGAYDGVVWSAWALLVGGLAGACLTLIGVGLLRRRLLAAPPPSVGSGRQADELLQEVPVAALSVDAGGLVQAVNPAAYTFGLVHAGRVAPAAVRALVREVRRDGVAREADCQVEGAGVLPRNRSLGLRVVCLGGSDVAVVAHDRTEEQRVEAVRRDFVANLGHELKTPIGALGLLVEAALDAGEDRAAARRFLGRIDEEVRRLARLVRELTELSALQGSQPLPAQQPVQVAAVVGEAVERVRSAAAAKDVTLAEEVDASVRVLGSAPQLVTALTNLLDNAVCYSPAGTRVSVSAHAGGDGVVEILVADEGVGIPAEEVGRVFERFYRADRARSRATGGTGLGLAIVKHVVSNHGGQVSVWSTPGCGSTFTVRLPAAADRDLLPAASP